MVVVKLSGNNRRRRNSLRYPGYDYAQSGAVFVTLCTHNRQILFGAVEEGLMIHSPAGCVAIARWQANSTRFPTERIRAPLHCERGRGICHGALSLTVNRSGNGMCSFCVQKDKKVKTRAIAGKLFAERQRNNSAISPREGGEAVKTRDSTT